MTRLVLLRLRRVSSIRRMKISTSLKEAERVSKTVLPANRVWARKFAASTPSSSEQQVYQIPEDVNLSPEIVSLVMTVDPTKRLTQRRRSLMNGLEKRQRYLQQYTVNTRLPDLRVSWARYRL